MLSRRIAVPGHVAEQDAEWAEADAFDAINFASGAIEEATRCWRDGMRT